MTQNDGVSLNLPEIEREKLEVDVLLVGAGPATLACAIHLQRVLAEKEIEDKTVLVLEKAEDIGYHTLSGAVMDPRGMDELLPTWREDGCPVEAEVTFDCVDVLLPKGRKFRLKGPFVPPPMRNHGNVIVSLHRVVRWMKDRAEAAGVEVYPGFAGSRVLYDPENPQRVAGVQTRDTGIGKDGQAKSSFEPGMDVVAPITVFGEGTRGSLAKHLINKLGLDRDKNTQIYETGIKEVWELPEERGREMLGKVIHTMGLPLGTSGYGGGFIYGLTENRVALGYVVGLDHHDARLDPHALFVQWKQHESMRALLDGGKVLRYGAKTIPGGGYFSMPELVGDGFCLVGDTAGFVNMQRLKGIHLAIKSGMMAAEAIADALEKGESSKAALSGYVTRFECSWAKEELWRTRNFRQAFESGFFAGLIDAAVQIVTGGRGLVARRKSHDDHSTTRPAGEARMETPRYDDGLSLDKLTDVYHSGTVHEEDQPSHLVLTDPSICVERCTEEFGNPCQYFCPAAVYEWPEEAQPKGVTINFSNCVHCKTCDIADPYQIIEWTVPESGGGPKYIDL